MNILDLLLGRPLATTEEERQRIGVFAGIPMLGLDALSSAAYGPEAALTILIPLGASGLVYFGPIIVVILAILGILFLSYRQTIEAYPGGGGSYTVASENLGRKAGLLAAAALLLDYVLNVAVGISAGVGALVSAVPSLHSHILSICLIILAIVALVNLRGIKESGLAFAIPTYGFLGSLIAVLAFGVCKTLASGGHPVAVEAPPAIPASTGVFSLWLVMRAFASGCTAMTGVEAVSNGTGAFARPTSKNAAATLAWIVALLAVLLAGIAFLCKVYGIAATDPDGANYQSVLSMLIAAVVGRGFAYYVTLATVLAVLALSANTSFADFPRLCRLLALDEFLPRSFSIRGRRLVFSGGIMVLTVLSAILLIAFGGITDRLIPLFAVGAFLAFTMSQSGMVIHWWKNGGGRAWGSMIINGLGAVCTASALVVILAAKFVEGAWITVLLIPAAVVLFEGIHRHYQSVAKLLACDDPMDPRPDNPPIVVVPVKVYNRVTAKALHFAMGLSPDVIALHVIDDEDAANLPEAWKTHVEEPLRAGGRQPPSLKMIESPYRRLFQPLLAAILDLEKQNPARTIAVVIPELVEANWRGSLLHNQRAELLKAVLLFRGNDRIAVINVPWYLDEAQSRKGESADGSH